MLPAKRESYVTSADTDEEAFHALVLSRSIRRSLTSRNVSVVVSDNVSPFMRLLLENEFDYVFGVQSERLKEYGDAYLKYSCWKLKLWTKCVYISPFALVLENCDHLFELEPFSVLHDGNGSMSVDLFVCKPDMTVFQQLLQVHKQVMANNEGFQASFQMQTWNTFSLDSAALKNSCGDNKLALFNMTRTSSRNDLKWLEIVCHDVIPSVNGLGEVDGLKSSLEKLLQKLGIPPPKLVSPSNHTVHINPELLDNTIAIIGMSCRFPGANNPEEFWEMLAEGRDGISSFPFERLSPREKSIATPAAYDGGFLKCPVDEFDARFFGMSPREAQFVDPQQRLLLEVTWEALENAGINPLSLKGTKTSAYVGIHMQDYEKLIKPVGSQEYHHSYLGNCFSATASRVSYFLGLVGPNVAVESGCSSAMVAVHLACENLKHGESSLSLASGVNLLLKRNEKSGATLMAVLSPDSRCKTFDSSANGFARAEGCGTLVMKRLGDALRNGDNVLALIRGSAINNDGPGQSFGTPSAASQEKVIREALLAAGMNPAEISYVEAHGTGTPVGDPLEFQGLTNAYSTPERKEPLIIGSVKTNIGHTESAAGIAGIIKVVLCMKNKAISPHLHLKKLNSRIDLSTLPAKIPTELTEWNAPTKTAGVSSFSMSGTSTHAIIQEAPRNIHDKDSKPLKTGNPQLITLSAKTQVSLENLIKKYIDYLSKNESTDIQEVAFTLNQCRANFPYRTTCVAASASELKNLLQNGEYSIQHVPSTGHNKIGFLFTGQGSQHFGMGKALYGSSLPFKIALNQVATLYESHLNVKLQDVLWNEEKYLHETIYCQPAIFCVEYALAQHWIKLGMKPDYVLGHSIGEFGAAVCAGLLTLEDAMKLVVERSRLVNTLPTGRMLVLKTSHENTKTLIKKFQLDHPELAPIDIAAVNASNEVVVSSSVESVDRFEEFCAMEKVRVIKLAASHAFHSRQMDPVLDEFGKIAKSVKYSQMNDITYISGTLAKEMTTSDFESIMYWNAHLRHTVHFADAVKLMNKSGCNIFLETGPQPVLLGLTMGNIDYSANNVFCSSLKNGEQDWTMFLNTLSKLYLAGISYDLNAMYKTNERPNKIQLPTYAFERQKFWFVDEDDVPEQDVYKMSATPVHPILGSQMRTPFTEQLYSSKLSPRRLQYLSHHKICEHIILPGAAFLEATLAVGSEILNANGQVPLIIQDLFIAAALPVESTVLLETVVKVRNDTAKNDGIQYEISFQRPVLGDTWKHHATAVFTPGAVLPIKDSIDIEAIKAKLHLRNGDSLSALYRQLAKRGINFGSQFQSIGCAWTNANEILAQLEVPKSQPNEEYICHPIVLDAMIQTFAFGFALNDTGKENAGEDKSLRLPLAIRKFIWLAKPVTKVLYAHAFVESGSTEAGDISLHDELGNCVAVMEQLELVKVRADAFERNLVADRTPLPGFYHKTWKPLIAECAEVEVEHQKETEIENVVILFNTSAESRPLVKELAAGLTAKGRHVLVVNHTEEAFDLKTVVNRPEGFEYNFDFKNKSHFDNFLMLLQNVILRNGEKQEELEGMYYFCTGDNHATADQEIYKVNCGGLLNLCQTIISHTSKQDEQGESRRKLVVVTKGVWTTDKESAGHPNNAPIWGITKNFISECHVVDAKIVDIGLEEQRLDEVVTQLLQTFWASADEKFLAIKNGKTLTERVSHMANATKVLTIPNVDRYTVVVPSTGTISDLQVRPCNRKNPTGSFVEVAVKAVGLNFHDLMTILKPEGFHESVVLDEDSIGMDISGVVVAVGPDVKRRAVGDEIIGITSHGLQSHILIHENCLMAKPKTMTFPGASTIPCVFMTSYYSLVEVSKISANDRVLIHVGTGGVGLSAIQIAKSAGAEIYTTAGTKRKREYLRSVLGLKNIYNSRNTEYGEQIKRDTKGLGVTIVLNSLTGPNFKETTLDCCAKGASFVEIGKINTWTVDEVKSLRPDVKYTVVDLYPMIVNGEKDPTITSYLQIFVNLMEDQIISALPRTTFSLERIRDAFGYFQKAKHIGKIVVKMPEPKLSKENGKFCLCHEYFDVESTYLITGGLGAIGMEVTKWMAATGARHIILVGRNGPTPQNVKALEELRAQGCNVQAWQADVGDLDECSNILTRIKNANEFPPLRGIFLATGVISDSLISNQSWEKFELTFHSKVYPAWNFHQLTLDYDLDFFTMFSSMVSSIGTAGQSNHSAACSYLDSLAHYRQAHGLVSSAINWGAWSDIGQASNQRLGQEGMFGYRSFTPAQGIRAMEHFISQNLTEASIAEVANWNLIHANLNCGKFFDDVMSTEETDSGTSQEVLWKLVEDSANDYERQLNLEEYLKNAIRGILKLRVTDVIDKNQELSELGVDSLTAMELRNHLQKMLGTKVVTPDAMQENRTIQKLAAHLANLFNSTASPTTGAPMSLTELVTSDCVLAADICVSPEAQRPAPKSELKTVFLTGATGFVGVHVAYEILTKTNWTIICLVRAESSEAAMGRFMKTLNRYELPTEELRFERITFVTGDIVKDKLGLIPEEYDSIASRADAIVHCAAKVHLLELYTCNDRASSLRAVNYIGFSNVLRFTVAKKVKWFYHPSYLTVATSTTEGGYFMERFPTILDYSEGLTNGYIISKFVQEVLISQMREIGVPCTVLRLPGVWGNEMSSKAYKDVFTHMGRFLKACISFRKFPIFDTNNNNPDVGIPVMIVNAAAEIMVKLLGRPGIELGVYNSVSNCISNVITQACLEELMKDHGLECEFMDGKAWRNAIFNDNNEKTNFLLPFKYLYEDGNRSLRVLEVHPLLKEDHDVVHFDEKFTSKLRKNLPDLTPAKLSAKDILKYHYADELKQ